MGSLSIINRRNQRLTVCVDIGRASKGVVFLMHGLGRTKEEGCLAAIAEVCAEQGCTTVRFDAAHSMGESEGAFEDATVTHYYTDLEDVILWAAGQEWYREPFTLVGHSLGGMCALLFAQTFPSKVNGVVGVSSTISGELGLQTYPPGIVEYWKQHGMLEWNDEGVHKRLKWACAQDGLAYDALKKAHLLQMPLLLVTGERDTFSPLAHQELLKNAVGRNCELRVIASAGHVFKEQEHLKEIQRLFGRWLAKIS